MLGDLARERAAGPFGAPPAAVLVAALLQHGPFEGAVAVSPGPRREVDAQVGIPAANGEVLARVERRQRRVDEEVGTPVEPEVVEVKVDSSQR
jgi:hypothetical protein